MTFYSRPTYNLSEAQEQERALSARWQVLWAEGEPFQDAHWDWMDSVAYLKEAIKTRDWHADLITCCQECSDKVRAGDFTPGCLICESTEGWEQESEASR